MSQKSKGRLNTRIERKNINKMMQFHLNSYHWSHDQVNEIKNDRKTIHLFATKENRDNHNTKKLREQNMPTTPVAVIKAIIQGSCGYKCQTIMMKIEFHKVPCSVWDVEYHLWGLTSNQSGAYIMEVLAMF